MSGCVNEEIPSIIIDYMVLPVSQVVSHLDKTYLPFANAFAELTIGLRINKNIAKQP